MVLTIACSETQSSLIETRGKGGNNNDHLVLCFVYIFYYIYFGLKKYFVVAHIVRPLNTMTMKQSVIHRSAQIFNRMQYVILYLIFQ